MVELGDTAYSEGPTPAAVGSLVGQTLGGRYRITKLIGSGGMGAVYRAEHIQLCKPVALKVLNAEMAVHREAALRFEREAMVSAKIQHPHVVSATDSGRLPDGSLYLVLEYVEGRSLRALVDAEKRLPMGRALAICAQIADALDAAHRADVVHRDLKPGNIMLLEHEGHAEFVKVLDFGLAKHESQGVPGEPLTRSGSIFGTPEYMAPEQARGEVVDHRADLYALGVILYELLAGKPPFQAPELVAVLVKHIHDPPPPLPLDVPSAIADYVMSLLEKSPDKRPSDARAVAKTLRKLGPPAPVLSSMPPPPSARGVKGKARATLLRVGEMLERIPFVTVMQQPSGWVARLRSKLGVERPAWLDRSLRAVASRLPISVLNVLRHSGEPRARSARIAVVAGVSIVLVGAAWFLWPRGVSSELAERARAGEPKALGELAAVPVKKRDGRASLALGVGYISSGQMAKGLDALGSALDDDSDLAEDPELIRAVRRAAEDITVRDRALELIAERLGPVGADVLYDIWMSTPNKTPLTTAARKWLDTPALRAKARPAAVLALEVREAKNCGMAKDLLPRLTEDGDERSRRPLERFQNTSGCGFLGLQDCYPCLRGNDALEKAIAAVSARPAPKFGAK